ncbi:MAG: endolytic transglycosylase MltG [Paludibacteraceae bacterium]|nr:endolytic transglycosylase MltG [Paludibacteraceae bacterium]
MKKKHRRIVIWSVVVLLLLLVAWRGGVHAYRMLKTNVVPRVGQELIYIRRTISVDSLLTLLQEQADVASRHMFCAHAKMLHVDSVPAGCYRIADEGDRQMLRRFGNGWQEPVRITFNNIRTPQQLAGRLADQLLADSADFARWFNDGGRLAQYGVDTANLFYLFRPDTYEVYWTVTPQQLLDRMRQETDDFWTNGRLQQAAAIGLTPQEVVTLASIVGSETRNVAEMPTVAGLYINRLRKGMLLQSDPTVIYAVGDFSIRRVRNDHLTCPSPYNTYLNRGLPPGPIKMPTVDNIDAVLNAGRHDYLYMCAKETFDGTHNFAASYQQHLSNARRYQAALNQRGIH